MGASPKQVEYMEKLLTQRVVPPAVADVVIAHSTDPKMTPGKFSPWLDKLKGYPWPAKATLGPGTYLVGDEVYQVVKSKSSGKAYAKVLRDGGFEYDPAAIFKLPLDAQPVTLQQAIGYGLKHNRCIFGGHPLRAAQSVMLAVGPVCAKREFGVTQAQLIKAQLALTAPAPATENALTFG